MPAIAWSSVIVRASARGAGRDVTGPDRLALLYMWYRDDRPPRVASADVVFQGAKGAPLATPRGVDWSGFPWADAVSAVQGLGSRRRIATPLGFKPKG